MPPPGARGASGCQMCPGYPMSHGEPRDREEPRRHPGPLRFLWCSRVPLKRHRRAAGNRCGTGKLDLVFCEKIVFGDFPRDSAGAAGYPTVSEVKCKFLPDTKGYQCARGLFLVYLLIPGERHDTSAPWGCLWCDVVFNIPVMEAFMKIGSVVFLAAASAVVFAGVCRCYGVSVGGSSGYVYGAGGETEMVDIGGGRIVPASLPWGGDLEAEYSCDDADAENYLSGSLVVSPGDWAGGRGWSGTLRCLVGGSVRVYWEREYEGGREAYLREVIWDDAGGWSEHEIRGGCVLSESWSGGEVGAEYVCGGEHVRSSGGVVHGCTSGYEYGGCYIAEGTMGMDP